MRRIEPESDSLRAVPVRTGKQPERRKIGVRYIIRPGEVVIHSFQEPYPFGKRMSR